MRGFTGFWKGAQGGWRRKAGLTSWKRKWFDGAYLHLGYQFYRLISRTNRKIGYNPAGKVKLHRRQRISFKKMHLRTEDLSIHRQGAGQTLSE